MVTPAVLRLDTEERVVVEAPGLSAATEANLLVQDFPLKRQVLHRIQVPLNPAEGMLASTTIKVCHNPRATSGRSLPPPAPGEGGPWGLTIQTVEILHGAGGTWVRDDHHGVFGRSEVLGDSHPKSLGTVTLEVVT